MEMGLVSQHTSKDIGGDNETPYGRAHKRFSFSRFLAETETFSCANGFPILFLTAYVNANLMMFFWGAREQFKHTKGQKMRWLISIARGFGYTLNLNCALVIVLASRLLFTVIRRTPLNLVFPFDKTFPAFHMIVGYVIAISVMGHGIFHMVWIAGWKKWSGGLWGISMCVCTGFLLSGILATMVFTSRLSFRKGRFKAFFAVHNAGAFFFFTILIFHGVYNGKPYTYKWLVLPLVIYICDRVSRRIKISSSNLDLNKEHMVLKGEDVLRIKTPKEFSYQAGQYAEIKVPSIDKLEWHPFTIASAPSEGSMHFYIKTAGDWTRALREAFMKRIYDETVKPLQIRMRGPFGAPAQHVGGYERVVLISGGVGATPFLSICKELYNFIETTKDTNPDATPLESANTPTVKKACQSLMDCVTHAYEQSTGADNDHEVDVDDDPLTMSELFVSTNDWRDVQTSKPHPQHAQDLDLQQLPREGSKLLRPIRKKRHRSTDRGPLKTIGMPFHLQDRPLEKSCNGTDSCDGTCTDRGSSGIPGCSNSHILSNPMMDTLGALATIQYELENFRRQRFLFFLHTVSVNLVTCIVVLLRIVLVGYASIFDYSMLRKGAKLSPFLVSKDMLISSMDVILGTFVTVVITVTLALELWLHKEAFFNKKGFIIDFFLLLPMSAASLILDIHHLLWKKTDSLPVPPLIHFFVLLPMVVILLLFRLHRIIGSRLLLADSYKAGARYGNMRAVDFIWTVPFEADDEWLREELVPLANGNQLRLHRFLTRQDNVVSENGYALDSGMTTSFGRPNWDELFQRVAERTPSDGKVGVFFCGPQGMSKAVRSAIMKVQVLTNLRGMYLQSSSDKIVSGELGIETAGELETLRTYGSNVQFVFREENFG